MQTCEIKCEECETIHSFDCSNLNWECVNSNERDMGTENNHQAVIQEECACGKPMLVEFNCYEYPEGVKETSDIKMYGVTMVKNDCPPCPDLS